VGFSEARDQDDAGLAMTMQTVINRATDPLARWPRTLCGVVLQPGQYLGVDTWPVPRHPDRIDAASWERALIMADHVIAGDAPIPDACAHATGFDQAPIARDDIRFACHLGAHTFYVEPPLSAAAN
jgi:spore germination cell wall hydrolase CwlJ-like protein